VKRPNKRTMTATERAAKTVLAILRRAQLPPGMHFNWGPLTAEEYARTAVRLIEEHRPDLAAPFPPGAIAAAAAPPAPYPRGRMAAAAAVLGKRVRDPRLVSEQVADRALAAVRAEAGCRWCHLDAVPERDSAQWSAARLLLGDPCGSCRARAAPRPPSRPRPAPVVAAAVVAAAGEPSYAELFIAHGRQRAVSIAQSRRRR